MKLVSNDAKVSFNKKGRYKIGHYTRDVHVVADLVSAFLVTANIGVTTSDRVRGGTDESNWQALSPKADAIRRIRLCDHWDLFRHDLRSAHGTAVRRDRRWPACSQRDRKNDCRRLGSKLRTVCRNRTRPIRRHAKPFSRDHLFG